MQVVSSLKAVVRSIFTTIGCETATRSKFVRNGVEIDHNLFDFDTKLDHGNLISGFGDVAASGPVSFHDNLVSNPGRGVIWINEVCNNIVVRNNHIIARTTATPREEGLFGFNAGNDFATVSIRDNLIECIGQARPLLRAPRATPRQLRTTRSSTFRI